MIIRSRTTHLIGLILLALLANATILLDLPLLAQTAAALTLAGLLPGYLLTDWLIGTTTPRPAWWTRALYTIGTAYATITITTLLISYLPGGITRWHTLITFNLLTLGLLLLWLQDHPPIPNPPSPIPHPPKNGRRITHLIRTLVGGLLRFANLGYSEFQGDEARVMLRAAETIQGHPNAVLGHTKGPTEILIPTAIYSITRQISELPARLPFTIANFAALFAIFALGTRMINRLAGWSAAMLLAVDGYLIGFAHIVQYQSIVFLCVTLTMLILYTLAQEKERITARDQTRYLTLAAILFGTGLLSHYEAILILPACLFLLVKIWPIPKQLANFWQTARIPLLVGAAIIALFYIPFVLNPNFATTYAYITVNRIGIGSEEVAAATGGFPYNNFADIFNRTTLYSSTYYFVLLIALGAVAIIGIALTKWRRKLAAQTILIWFAVPCLISLFFVATPNTHVYGFFIPWALLAAIPIHWFWLRLNNQRIGLAIAAALIALFGTYQYWLFAHTGTEVLRTWQQNKPRAYWTAYDMPINRSIFGFPFQNGWKTVQMLYADGTLNGAFDTNANEAVAEWYTRGLIPCERDARYFIWSHRVEPAEAADLEALRADLFATSRHVGTISVNGTERLQIFERGEPLSGGDPPPFRYANDLSVQSAFDAAHTDPAFERHGPTGRAQALAAGMIETDFRFGSSDGPIKLMGYRVAPKSLQPNAQVTMTLYWQTDAPIDTRYAIFNQFIDRADNRKAGQRDGEPLCNTLPTDRWLPNNLIADRYRIPIAPDAQPGVYSTLLGMYDRETGSRLPIFTADGNNIGDAIGIDQIEVVE